jgi:hypothetical protein
MVKALAKRLVSRFARDDRCWQLLDRYMLCMARFAEYERQDVVFRRRVAEVIRATFPELTVLNGPFRGLRYPSADAICSAILPKLLGSYERELHCAIEQLCKANCSVVVDVGCAEGYYAVGLARRLQTATVFAFDIDPKARELCRQMATTNAVSERVVIAGKCEPNSLAALVAGRPAIVVCDCEGFELDLLTPSILPSLAKAELLVETHDFTGVDIAAPLSERLGATHDVTVVAGTDDDAKVRHYHYAEVDRYDRATRKFILAERRPAVMEWLVATPRAAAG